MFQIYRLKTVQCALNSKWKNNNSEFFFIFTTQVFVDIDSKFVEKTTKYCKGIWVTAQKKGHIENRPIK